MVQGPLRFTSAMAACLLQAHADVAQVLECSECLPCVEVMRWIFELCSVDRVWNVTWSPLIFFAKQREDSMLNIVGLLAEFHCVIP